MLPRSAGRGLGIEYDERAIFPRGAGDGGEAAPQQVISRGQSGLARADHKHIHPSHDQFNRRSPRAIPRQPGRPSPGSVRGLVEIVLRHVRLNHGLEKADHRIAVFPAQGRGSGESSGMLTADGVVC